MATVYGPHYVISDSKLPMAEQIRLVQLILAKNSKYPSVIVEIPRSQYDYARLTKPSVTGR